MKVVYSQLKKYLPNLKKTPNEVAQAFTLTGHMIDKIIEVEYLGAKDFLLDLEVRQNRADLFSVIGLARELSVYWNIDLNLPEPYEKFTTKFSDNLLKLEVKNSKEVKRIKALKISNIRISESPEWLKEYLEVNGINSINNLIDLTNYVMLETGIPSHVFDSDLVGEYLCWELAGDKYRDIITLSGQKLKIDGDTLVISDGSRALSLSFIGGLDDAVHMDTKNIILEFGIYNQATVLRNSRNLKVITEASTRLEKFLDSRLIDHACSLLVDLILRECGGKVEAQFDWEGKDEFSTEELKMRTSLMRQIVGVDISNEFAFSTLNSLGFQPSWGSQDVLVVKPALGRTDVVGEYDLIEEVVRFYGYDKIPTDKISLTVTRDITPKRLVLMDNITDILINLGYDEIRSWVLVNKESNSQCKFYPTKQEIEVTNSINDEVPILRSSIAVNLLDQYNKMNTNGILYASIFEIGKIFYYDDNHKPAEFYSLSLLHKSDGSLEKDLEYIVYSIQKLLAELSANGILSIVPSESLEIPIAHQKSKFEVKIDKKIIGHIFITSKFNYQPGEVVLAELNLEQVFENVKGYLHHKAIEMTTRIVTRDINLIFDDEAKLIELIESFVKQNSKIYDWRIVDRFILDDSKTKYTLRLELVNITEDEANKVVESFYAIAN